MRGRKQIVQEAMSRALHARRSAGIALSETFCVFDFADQVGVEVRFVDAPSMEAAYACMPRPVILVSTWRPPGRKAYNCAHELGHHFYGHGMRVDELLGQDGAEEGFDPGSSLQTDSRATC
jgi:Zn-dependent peptidase ImmA (M78 family)